MEIKATYFYVRPEMANSRTLRLDKHESFHLVKTMRIRPGEIFYAIDGTGKLYKSVFIKRADDMVFADVAEITYPEVESKCRLTLACGLARPATTDFIVEKGTELGISRFIFYTSERTVVDVAKDNDSNKRMERWQRVALAAAKQSLRTIIPEFAPAINFSNMLEEPKERTKSFLANFRGKTLGPEFMADKPDSVILLIGPESGLTEHEVSSAVKAGFIPISLGPRRLRAETAALTFTSIIMASLGEL